MIRETPLGAQGEKKRERENGLTQVLVELLFKFVVGFLLFLLAMVASVQKARIISPFMLRALED